MHYVISFLARRLAQSVVIVLLVTFLIFVILRLVPGDPVRLIAGPMATPETVERVSENLGLNEPILVQYWKYMSGVVRGDFGTSFIRPESGQTTGGGRGDDPTRLDRADVIDLIAGRLPLTLQLAALAICFAFLISMPIGLAAGIYRARWPDSFSIITSSIMVSVPNFWLASVLVLVFSINLGWLPAVGYRGFSYMILPAVVLAIELAPVLIRAVASSLGSILNEGFIKIGEARGLSRRRMIWAHGVRNAAAPVLNVLGIQLGVLLGGVLIVEYVFDFPGLGHLSINAVLQRDFPVIQAITILASVIFIFVNILVDLFSSIIDPRLEY